MGSPRFRGAKPLAAVIAELEALVATVLVAALALLADRAGARRGPEQRRGIAFPDLGARQRGLRLTQERIGAD